MIILEMKKLQYDINRKAAEISDLSLGKIDKCEYLTGKEILRKKKKKENKLNLLILPQENKSKHLKIKEKKTSSCFKRTNKSK